MNPEKIIISRTDNLGDVMLTLPVAGILKKRFPQCKIYFIGKAYTKALIETCVHIDKFIDREEVINNDYLQTIRADVILHVFPDRAIAKEAAVAKIPFRVGTSHRWFHWLYCNKLVDFSRKNSDLHEAQLNLKLLEPLGISSDIDRAELEMLTGFSNVPSIPKTLEDLLVKGKFNLILHPKSKGSAREWPMENYYKLAQLLSPEHYQIFISGTAQEGELIKKQKPEIFTLPNVTDLTGKCSLEELIGFIARADGLVACSTGPLHIASSLEKYAIGIYPPMRPIHPGRWAPLGKHVTVLAETKPCDDCRKNFNCHCIQSITPELVLGTIENWK